MKIYSVYVLIKNYLPVYVGCSCNLKNRLSSHKKNKDYDHYYVLEKFKVKKEALAAERNIIHFYSLFRNVEWSNKEKVSYQISRHFDNRFKPLNNDL